MKDTLLYIMGVTLNRVKRNKRGIHTIGLVSSYLLMAILKITNNASPRSLMIALVVLVAAAFTIHF